MFIAGQRAEMRISLHLLICFPRFYLLLSRLDHFVLYGVEEMDRRSWKVHGKALFSQFSAVSLRYGDMQTFFTPSVTSSAESSPSFGCRLRGWRCCRSAFTTGSQCLMTTRGSEPPLPELRPKTFHRRADHTAQQPRSLISLSHTDSRVLSARIGSRARAR